MTEDEAKTKWCPHVVASHTNPRQREWADGDREEPTGPYMHRCIGSDCSQWRRQTVMIDRATNEPAIPGKAALGDLELRWSAHGYCGLAGAPQ